MAKLLLLIIIMFSGINSPSDKTKMLRFDATANFAGFSYHDSITFHLDKTKQLGFTDVVVDIKPIFGEFLYKSKIAIMMTEWNGIRRADDFDYLNFFIKESHKRNFKINASFIVFVGRHNFFNRGIVYDDHEDWQFINYTDTELVPLTKLKHKYLAMLNPANFEV